MTFFRMVRIVPCAMLVAAFAAPAAGQAPAAQGTAGTSTQTQGDFVLQGDTTPRPALPTFYGDTGLWFIPTAETMPAGRWSFSVFRANFDYRQGLTDVNQIGLTGAVALGNRVELFGSWRAVRVDRDVRPTFVPADPTFGGVPQEYPNVRRGWSGSVAGPTIIGGKWSVFSQSRGAAVSLAPRVMVTFPSGPAWAGTDDRSGRIDLVASREFGRQVEVTGLAGAVLRADPDEFRVSNGVAWGVGAGFPSRSAVRALVEWQGEFALDDNTVVINPPYVAADGSIAPRLSPTSDSSHVKIGAVWQAQNGFFLHGGLNYSFGTGSRTVGGFNIAHHALGADVRIGWHRGVTPARERVRVAPAPAPVASVPPPPVAPPPVPPPPPNRSPVFTVNATCDPCSVEPGQTSTLSATATDADGDPVTYQWAAPQGTFNNLNAASTVWTAPAQVGSVLATVTARDNRGGTATSSVTIQVARRVITFEDVHFDFDRFNLRPDAVAILNEAVATLQANPALNVTVEGHCDGMGTAEYNLALGERRANSVRDYLVSRGVAMNRLRAVSYGEERPVGDNATDEGRAMNRRSHLAVIIQ